MTSKDKTGDQLVASIRKSKSGAVTRKSGDNDTASSTDQSTPAAASATAAESAAPARARTSKPKPASKATTGTRQDGYSSGRRVWPD